MNVSALVVCIKNGKKHYEGNDFRHVDGPFIKAVRHFPVRKPKRCRVEVTALFDGTGPSCSGRPPTCFSQPGKIRVDIYYNKNHPFVIG